MFAQRRKRSLLSWTANREYDFKTRIGTTDHIYKTLYSNYDHSPSDEPIYDFDFENSVYNLEFSPDGSLLVAACKDHSIMILDPFNKRKIRVVDEAHLEGVNFVKFLDLNTFATCSDDRTVAIWDMRNLNQKVRHLSGHQNWVKSIDYVPDSKLLITSGFDGYVLGWKLHDVDESTPQQFFQTNGLMRTRLSPDGTKLIMCTSSGYMIIIHDVDFRTLGKDLTAFKPMLYRLMQQSDQILPLANKFTYLFKHTRKRNRVEFITDFPPCTESVLVINSIQIHPFGWNVLSRSMTEGETQEWTCVHDLQQMDSEEIKKYEEDIVEHYYKSVYFEPLNLQPINRPDENNRTNAASNPTPLASVASPAENGSSSARTRERNNLSGTNRNPNINDMWEAVVSIDQLGFRDRPIMQAYGEYSFAINMSWSNSGLSDAIEDILFEAPTLSADVNAQPQSRAGSKESMHKQNIPYLKNMRRLTHYIKEHNIGKGYIKETCFSPDGRIVCSPYKSGVRLFSFSPDCQDLFQCVLDEPKRLHQLTVLNNAGRVGNAHAVVTSKFSPRHSLLVTGNLNGVIDWYCPVF